ncbi:unnamed protein product [Lathyrus oleraceus]
MSKLPSTASIGTVGSVIRRNRRRKCYCQDECVLRTVIDMNSVNFGERNWGCRNYRNHVNKSCNFFKWLDDDIVDERDLKIQRQKKKIYKLKNEIIHTRRWLKVSIVVGILSLVFNVVFVTMYF